MKKNLAVDVPRDAETEVDRIRGLKKSIFTRTRIACLCLVMVLALSVSSTLAFEKWSGNATPNRTWNGEVDIKIGEATTITAADSDYKYDSEAEGDYSYGKNSKVVRVTAGDKGNQMETSVTVSLVLEVETLGYRSYEGEVLEGSMLCFDEDWSMPINDGTDWYIESSILRVYLNNDWQSDWTYVTNKGVFQYNSQLSRGESTPYLVRGVEIRSDVSSDAYETVKLSVVAKGVDATARS